VDRGLRRVHLSHFLDTVQLLGPSKCADPGGGGRRRASKAQSTDGIESADETIGRT
jgi:hypothetical protein